MSPASLIVCGQQETLLLTEVSWSRERLLERAAAQTTALCVCQLLLTSWSPVAFVSCTCVCSSTYGSEKSSKHIQALQVCSMSYKKMRSDGQLGHGAGALDKGALDPWHVPDPYGRSELGGEGGRDGGRVHGAREPVVRACRGRSSSRPAARRANRRLVACVPESTDGYLTIMPPRPWRAPST